jgi:hypothetical protein
MRKQAMWERAVENVSKSGPDLLMGVLQTFAPANDNRARSALELYELQRKQSAGTELTEAERARVDVLLQELG